MVNIPTASPPSPGHYTKTGFVPGERRNGLGARAMARKLQMHTSSAHKILNIADVN